MRVLLGVAGGIAAYKAAELVRRLIDAGDEVQVVLTKAAERFVTPRTFAVLSKRPVLGDLWRDEHRPGVEHVEAARWAEVLAVAPATADVVAKLAHGLADDALTTLALAYRGPFLVAPSMNWAMLDHPATRRNLETLRGRGVTVVEPDDGFLAEGEHGPGRLPEPTALVAAIHAAAGRARSLAGRKLVLTAGPTREPIDPVRFLSNASSGRMGWALAEAARDRGADVVLVAGPVELAPPAGVKVVGVTTARQMRDAVFAEIGGADAAILVAAVADLSPARPAGRKLPKAELPTALPLEPTPDILAELGRLPSPRPLLVGFAAQTEDPVEAARRKLTAKGCDMIVANDVSRADVGFGSEDNEVVLVAREGEPVTIPKRPKREIAERILDAVEARLEMRGA